MSKQAKLVYHYHAVYRDTAGELHYRELIQERPLDNPKRTFQAVAEMHNQNLPNAPAWIFQGFTLDAYEPE